MQIETLPIASLHADPANVRKHPDRNRETVKASLARFGQQRPILIDSRNIVRAGNATLAAAAELGWTEIQCVRTELPSVDATAYAIADNRSAELAIWDTAGLAKQLQSLADEDFDMMAIGFDDEEIKGLIAEAGKSLLGEEAAVPAQSLAERFGVPPFTVLDARQGYWQDRKRAWLSIGIQSELGRGEGDRACPSGSPMPGRGSRKDYEPGQTKAAAAAGA